MVYMYMKKNVAVNFLRYNSFLYFLNTRLTCDCRKHLFVENITTLERSKYPFIFIYRNELNKTKKKIA